MVNFRKTLMVVASLAMVAGLASAAETSGVVIDTKTTSFSALLVRSEGVTELMPTVTFTLSSVTADTTYDVTIISTAPITSLKSALKFKSKTAATIAGNTATFAAVPFAAAAVSSTFTLEGLRVDATQLPNLATGQTGIGENVIVVMSSTVGKPFTDPFDGTSPITTVTGLAYAVKSLTVGVAGTGTDGAASSFLQCAGLSETHAFDVTLAENFGAAWTTLAGEGPDATQGTQFSLAFTNLPTNVKLWVPVSYSLGGEAPIFVLTLKSPSSPTLNDAKNLAQVPASGVVVYEVTTATTGAVTPAIPVYVSYVADSTPSLTTSAAPVTVTVQYAPQSTNAGASTAKDLIPRFLGAAQSSTKTFVIGPCNSTILFPYVVNTPGYDTGLAITNAGNLDKNDSGQSGTCQWSFYGDGAPTTAGAPTASIDPGTTQTALLSALAPGLNGFAVASCNFEGGYGYAFIVGKLGGNEVAQGYLGLLSGQTGTFGFFPYNY
jgi:hypothetical protein